MYRPGYPRAMRSLVVCVLLVGCTVRHRVVVEPRELQRNVPELTTGGSASVAIVDQRDGEVERRRETLRVDQQVTVDGQRRTIGDLVRGCTTSAVAEPQPGCPLSGLDGRALELRTYESIRLGPIIGAVSVAGLVGGGTCYFACEDGSDAKRAADITLIATGALILGGVTWIVVDCFRHGCRD